MRIPKASELDVYSGQFADTCTSTIAGFLEMSLNAAKQSSGAGTDINLSVAGFVSGGQQEISGREQDNAFSAILLRVTTSRYL